MVDPRTPHSWKQQPYYAQIKLWAADYCAQGKFVRIVNGRRQTVILPDHDEDVGILTDGDALSLMRRQGPDGITYRVKITRADEAQQA